MGKDRPVERLRSAATMLSACIVRQTSRVLGGHGRAVVTHSAGAAAVSEVVQTLGKVYRGGSTRNEEEEDEEGFDSA